MDRCIIDIETASSYDIRKAGGYKYALAPDFRIILIAYKWNDEPVRQIDRTDPNGDPLEWVMFLKILKDPNVIKMAHNAAFEWFCLNAAGLETPIDQWRDTMSHAMYLSYPPSLEACGKAIGLPDEQLKMSEGKTLIRYFCQPTKDGTYRAPSVNPERWEIFKEYNRRDVETEYFIQQRLDRYPMPEEEIEQWRADVLMNAYGVPVDTELLQGALYLISESEAALMNEAKELTGLDNPNSTQQLMPWLNDHGCSVSNLTKDTVAKALDGDVSADVRRVLEIRQELSKTSVKKYEAIADAICADNRVRGISLYYGATRSGRWSGRLVQLQNLTKHYIGTLDEARALVKRGDYAGAKMIYGNIYSLLSQIIRTVFVPSDGRKFVVADFSAIEARVIAWLAGETWVNEVFATHGKIYEATAAKMFHVPIDTIAKGEKNYGLRQKGKVASLALGYQGGTSALVAMGALNMGLTETELPDIVNQWRKANQNIVRLWRAMEDAAVATVQYGGRNSVRNGLVEFALETDVVYGLTFLTMRLPSGRKLYYAKPFIKENRFGKPAVHHYGVGMTKKWEEQNTYSGKLTENAIQSIARDCLALSLNRIRARGWDIVFHVHDEVVIDAPTDVTVEEVCALMCEPISWAPGLILKAAGFDSQYYMKD